EISDRPNMAVPEGGPDGSEALTGMTEIVFPGEDGPRRESVPTFARERLRAGNRLNGPAIVHEMDSTVVISPGWSGEVRPDGTIRLVAGSTAGSESATDPAKQEAGR